VLARREEAQLRRPRRAREPAAAQREEPPGSSHVDARRAKIAAQRITLWGRAATSFRAVAGPMPGTRTSASYGARPISIGNRSG